MDTPKHTPGPWSINAWTQGDREIAIGAIGTPLIAKAFLRDVSINGQKANADLIASAPDLYAACHELIFGDLGTAEKGDHLQRAIDLARIALGLQKRDYRTRSAWEGTGR